MEQKKEPARVNDNKDGKELLLDYQALIKHMKQGVVSMRMIYHHGLPVDCEILAVNPAFETQTGIKNPVGKRATGLYPGKRASYIWILEKLGRVCSTGIPAHFEFQIENSGRWFSVEAYSHRQDEVNIVMENISERKELENSLKRGETRFRQIAGNAGDVIWEFDAKGLYTYMSKNIFDILGYTKEEMEGRIYFYDSLDPEIREKFKSRLLSFLENKKPFKNLLSNHIHRNGSIVFFNSSGTPYWDENGKLLGYRGTGTNVTEEQQLINKLWISEKKYATIFQSMPIMIALSEPVTMRILEVNDCALNMTGFTRDEILGSENFPEEVISKADLDLMKAAIKEEGRLHNLEVTLHKKNGEEMICLYDLELIEIDGIPFVLSTGRDITLKRKLEEALKKSEVLLSQSRISPHFIFNAMNAIQGYIIRSNVDMALHYLGQVAKLIRLNLDFSYKHKISLAEEMVYLQNYLDIEKMRFEEMFQIEINLDPDIDIEFTDIPPLMIQPVVEFAIKQRLQFSNPLGTLKLDMTRHEDHLDVLIEWHNGVDGETPALVERNLTEFSESKITRTIQERIRMYNLINNNQYCKLTIFDMINGSGKNVGTRMELDLPYF